ASRALRRSASQTAPRLSTSVPAEAEWIESALAQFAQESTKCRILRRTTERNASKAGRGPRAGARAFDIGHLPSPAAVPGLRSRPVDSRENLPNCGRAQRRALRR